MVRITNKCIIRKKYYNETLILGLSQASYSFMMAIYGLGNVMNLIRGFTSKEIELLANLSHDDIAKHAFGNNKRYYKRIHASSKFMKELSEYCKNFNDVVKNTEFYALPGGTPKIPDNKKELEREIMEEIGIKIKVDEPICILGTFNDSDVIYVNPKDLKRFDHLTNIFICDFPGGDIKTSDESHGYKWVSEYDLYHMTGETRYYWEIVFQIEKTI